jgi:ankyrin repeat protein
MPDRDGGAAPHALDLAVHDFVRLIAGGPADEVARVLHATPALATTPARTGATRLAAREFFLTGIRHYVYGGDTALHIAAAAFRRAVAELLVGYGADVRARNRRGAEPLHYAADGNHCDPAAQAATIEYLASVGADARAVDRTGVAPLHRAVRTRSVAAVRALLDAGADPRQPNGAGSTPLHLAVQPTGRGGSGSEDALRQQAEILRLLLERGAKPTDRNARGKDVYEAAVGHSVRRVLDEAAR